MTWIKESISLKNLARLGHDRGIFSIRHFVLDVTEFP